MTKRAAILIASPTVHCNGLHSSTYLHGSFNDIYEWKRFLKQPVGGCWNDDEIYDMSEQNSGALLGLLDGLKDVDYIFFVYTGHGYREANDDYIFVNYGQDYVRVRDIEGAVKGLRRNIKATLIFDACRCGHIQETFAPKHGSTLLSENYPQNLRDAVRSYWDGQLASSQSLGVFTIQSCMKNQQSYMFAYNTYSVFSYIMLSVGWNTSEKMNICKAFEDAKNKTKSVVESWHNASKIQEPECSPITVDFPFSLSISEADCIMANRILQE